MSNTIVDPKTNPTSSGNPTTNPYPTAKNSNPISSPIDSLIKKAEEKRVASADIDTKSGGLNSGVKTTGDNTLFAAGTKQLGKQDFLNLLVTQLRYQDPLSPSENTEFVAQLAQFSSLEGTQNISESVEKLNGNMEGMIDHQKLSADTMAQASAVSLIGKRARIDLNEVQWDPANKKPLKFNVHAQSNKNVLVAITNAKGEAINVVDMKGGGDKELLWSGNKMDGSSAGKGTYGIRVVTKEDLETQVGYAYIENRITGLDYSSGNMLLKVGDQEVPLSKIASVIDDADPTTTNP
jgi:flagellar basal-body rod modification protein FlgD